MKIFIYILLISNIFLFAQNKIDKKIVDLNRLWKFEIGDNQEWARPGYDDSKWEEIRVPSSWEDEGFPGYDGYAWYRISFTVSEEYKGEEIYLRLGWIDDVDETYLNGKIVGYSGRFPPEFLTEAHNNRIYKISAGVLNYGEKENILAIKVFDGMGTGGIVRGDNFLFMRQYDLEVDQSLTGKWKFKTGDDPEWKNISIDDTKWKEVEVPALWASFGYKDYDGFAWYRKEFLLDEELKSEKLILLLGKIDDMDAAFINGRFVGKTGDLRDDPSEIIIQHADHQLLRAYYIPKSVLNMEGKNLISIRVYDGTTYGGIYEGPVGLITRKNYVRWKRKGENIFRDLFQKLFD